MTGRTRFTEFTSIYPKLMYLNSIMYTKLYYVDSHLKKHHSSPLKVSGRQLHTYWHTQCLSCSFHGTRHSWGSFHGTRTINNEKTYPTKRKVRNIIDSNIPKGWGYVIVPWRINSLKLTADSPLKIGRFLAPKRKRESIPSIHFQVRTVDG